MRFYRKLPPVKYRDYGRYRQLTRADFVRTCAYCFRDEGELGGEEQFVQDHFEPRRVNPARAADYLNLYWCCVGCNAGHNKGSHWPSVSQLRAGMGFCDPCVRSPFIRDYVQEDSGELRATSLAGEYTIRHIGLNRRPALVLSRASRQRKKREIELAVQELEAAMREVVAGLDDESRVRVEAVVRTVKGLVGVPNVGPESTGDVA